MGTNTRWRCQCNCEQKTIIDVYASNLLKKHTTSCGCVQKQVASKIHKKEEIGNRYGKLLVIAEGMDYIAPDGSNRKTWKCRCDCGNEIEVVGTSLRRGLTQSCGCNFKEAISQHWEEKILNTDFPNLKVLKRVEANGQESRWLCQCKFCNNTYILSTGNLKTSKGCGCLNISRGAYKIQQLLENNNLNYIKEKTFENCRFPQTNRKARFDFYVENKYLIEFDGLQHYQTVGGWANENNFIKTQERDNYKNNWCKKNNIPLIRIPYWKEDNLVLEDLLLETSNYLIN